ncbi:MAG: HAD family hydrolase [Oscillospiraceae bacterium]|jgi:phosphoglycolate phosphatase
MIKCVAFDLDGTLVNSLEDLADASNHALKDLGFPVHDVNEYRYFVGSGVNKLFERALPEEHKDEATVTKARKVFERYYNRCYCNKTVPYELVVELLDELEDAHYRLAVVTNKPDAFAKNILKTLFPHTEFDFIQGASDELPKKPDPSLLKQCMEELHMKPEDCIYCGDSDVDVAFAHNAGIPVAGAAWGFRGMDELEAAGADYIINYPNELLALLDILN